MKLQMWMVWVTGLVIAVATMLLPAAAAAPDSDAGMVMQSDNGQAVERSAIAVAFRADMRKLWEDHIIWTRDVIISITAGAPDLDAALGRLMKNQEDISNAIRPYYGVAASDKLLALLKEHIRIAGELVTAAKAGDAAKVADAKTRWYANGDEIAAFLSGANPANWPLDTLKSMMKVHLDTTMDEAVARLQGNWAADIAAFDRVHEHILRLADALSLGIIRQSPDKFRG